LEIRNKTLRIIDANINRATEGLRVAEDIVRFVLDDGKLTSKLKNIRHEIVRSLRDVTRLRQGFGGQGCEMRDVRGDVGAGRSTKSEGRRKNILDVFSANIKRAEESIRVFEELSKLFDAKFGTKFKKLRFKLYDIEQKAALKLKKKIKLDFNLYVITDPSFGRSHMEIMKAASKGGAKIIQYREKVKGKREMVKTVAAMSKYARAHDLTFIVNDDPYVALRGGADGVHMGIRDMGKKGYGLGIGELRKKGKIVGISASNLKEALHAQKLGADYIGFGPIFATPIKPGMKPLGIKALQRVMNRVMIPIVAIGGINKANIGQVLAAGCDRIAVIRAVSGAKDITKAVRDLIVRLSRHRDH
jgi:thiamine-phosphate pyrophosphorylase